MNPLGFGEVGGPKESGLDEKNRFDWRKSGEGAKIKKKMDLIGGKLV